MKRGVLATLGVLALLMAALPRVASAPLVLSKDGGGHILPNAVSIELKSNPDCDQTQRVIPDLSVLVSRSFTLNVDDKGIGFFAGPAQIVTPDGKPVMAGVLHGTVGLTAHRDATANSCHFPGHFEGMFNGQVFPMPTSTNTVDPAVALVTPFEVNFSADLVPQTAGPTAVYTVHLDGLIPAPQPPPVPRVYIAPSKPGYMPGELITAIITNRADAAVQAMDMNSFCTIVKLQRLVNNAWVNTYGCAQTRQPLPTIIKPGEVLKVGLPETAIPEFRYEPGAYRMMLTYQMLGPDGKPVGDPVDAISPVFRVGATTPTPVLKVMPDKPGYGPTDVVTAIITNGTSPLAIFDEQSFCTIVQLQFFDGVKWVELGPCPLDRMPEPTFLKPGEVLPVPLKQNVPWRIGRYRLAVTYNLLDAAGNPGATGGTVYSGPFPVMSSTLPQLVLKTDKRAYALTDHVTAFLANPSTMDAVTWDHRSFCTWVMMEKQMGTMWTPVAPCMLMTPSMPVPVKAGATLTQILPPDATTAPKWEAGTYRLVVGYQVPGIETFAPLRAVSDPFTIGATITGVVPRTRILLPNPQ